MTDLLQPVATSLEQPYAYARRELNEPDWRRFPGWADVTEQEWRSAQWQRSHCVKNIAQLKAVLGDLVDDRFYADVEADIANAMGGQWTEADSRECVGGPMEKVAAIIIASAGGGGDVRRRSACRAVGASRSSRSRRCRPSVWPGPGRWHRTPRHWA